MTESVRDCISLTETNKLTNIIYGQPAAEAKSENTEAEAEEVEGTCTGTMMNDGVKTTGDAGGRHPGLHTVNEEAGHIVFHTEHVEHDMNDDTGERTKSMHNTTNSNGEQTEIVIENENAEAGVEGTTTETMLNDAVEAAGGTGEEHSVRSTVNEESGHIVGEEHHARCAHSDEWAGSIVLHVSSDMNEKEKDDEEASETAAAKETGRRELILLYDFVEDLSHHFSRLIVACFDVFGSYPDAVCGFAHFGVYQLQFPTLLSISGILVISSVSLMCTSVLLTFPFYLISRSYSSCSLSSFFLKNPPRTLAILFRDVMISPRSFFILVMSTFFFADLIPGMFFTTLLSSSILWMSRCLFILFLSLIHFFMHLLTSFMRYFSSLGSSLLDEFSDFNVFL